MKSFEKKILIGFLIAIFSGCMQWSMLPLTEPTDLFGMLIFVIFAGWVMLTVMAILWCFAAVLFWGIVSLQSKYRESKRDYRNGLPVRCPKFFHFMKWLNTDDRE